MSILHLQQAVLPNDRFKHRDNLDQAHIIFADTTVFETCTLLVRDAATTFEERPLNPLGCREYGPAAVALHWGT